eukprot:13026746-Alexandrium_andersonii.AAC.1
MPPGLQAFFGSLTTQHDWSDPDRFEAKLYGAQQLLTARNVAAEGRAQAVEVLNPRAAEFVAIDVVAWDT